MTEDVLEVERARLANFLASPLGKFRSWRTPEGRCPQGEFLRAFGGSKQVCFRSGNRVGKTTIGVVAALLLALGWHRWARRKVPNHGWVSTLSWDFCAEVIWPKFQELLPMAEVQHISFRRKQAPPIPNQIQFNNGSTITFKSAEQKRAKYQGASLDWLWFDEEHPADIVEEGRARLIDTAGFLFVTLTPVMRARWVATLEREEETVVIRASMLEAAAAGLLPLHRVLAYAKGLPERQRRVRVHGEFVALEGLVYPEFSRITHCAYVRGDRLECGEVSWPWPLPEAWRRRSAIDFGFAVPTAIPLAVEDPFHNRLIVERLLYADQIRATLWAAHLNRLWPELCRPLVADHDAFARAELEDNGIPTVAADKDIESGLEAVERLLLPCGDGAPGLILVIHPGMTDESLGRIDADKLAWELEAYHYPERKDDKPDPKDLPVKKDDHACDATRYLVKDWERARGGPPAPPAASPKRPRPGTSFAPNMPSAWGTMDVDD